MEKIKSWYCECSNLKEKRDDEMCLECFKLENIIYKKEVLPPPKPLIDTWDKKYKMIK